MKLRAALLATLLAASATAAHAASEARNDALPAGPAGAEATVVPAKPNLNPIGVQAANVGKARVGLVYDFELGIIKSKGVSRVRKPGGETGLYCIKTTLSNATSRNLIPVVTVDYSRSAGEVLLAYIRSGASDCASYEIGIQTKRLSGGTFVDTDRVGWNLVAN